jgi:hypothetical protein
LGHGPSAATAGKTAVATLQGHALDQWALCSPVWATTARRG